jgi:type I restriction enzyme, S subunit
MESDWNKTNLGSLFKFANGRSCPSRKDEFPIRVYGSNGIIGYSQESNSEAKTIVIGRVGSYCGATYLSVEPCWVTDNAIKANSLPGNDSGFLFYLLDTLDLNSRASGSGQPLLNQSILNSIEVSVPPYPKQKAIAHILGSLDDKIELNRLMNTTLEGMAQTIFKSWFVDFEPVIDNALVAGNPIPEELAERAQVRSQALANGTANRQAGKNFPAAFQLTEEMGWIPEGWEVDQLGKYLDVLETGRRPKGGVSKYKTGVPSVGAESIHGVGRFDYAKTKFVPGEFFNKMKSGKVESYDVLLYKDGGKPGEFKPRSGMFGEGFPFEAFGINEHVFRMRSSTLGQGFLYYQVSSERVFHHLAVRGGKAAIPGINQQEVKSVDFLIPNEEVMKRFNDICQLVFEKLLKSANKSRVLSNLRDTLLPKLINGELHVPKAEHILGGGG